MNEVSERPGTDHDSSVFCDGAKSPAQPGCGDAEIGSIAEAWAALSRLDEDALDRAIEYLKDRASFGRQKRLERRAEEKRAAKASPQPEPVSRPTSPNTDESNT